MDRRDWIKSVAAASAVAWIDPLSAEPASGAETSSTPSKPDLIARENSLPGSLDWQLTRVRVDKTPGFRSPWIEGYCSKQSVSAGESIEILVSTDPPRPFKIEIFRTGYYGGARSPVDDDTWPI